jgi:IclR family mhp operon transcriptional activator
MLDHSNAPEDRFEPRRLRGLLQTVRAEGCALQDREINPKTSGISVPICRERIVACVSMIWIATALTLEEARGRYLAPLLRLADDIAAAIGGRRG